eukprot:TRINITY_DN1703_c0_g1_i1.p1 TRINITY_DN1703_c0_g1~~TRINITY_DN1703_c0_g1_i1.p1  ORF type:complete len:695 (+),score=236.53 TRINITY_DN1703_c0_g1_i1:95-2179(+)
MAEVEDLLLQGLMPPDGLPVIREEDMKEQTIWDVFDMKEGKAYFTMNGTKIERRSRSGVCIDDDIVVDFSHHEMPRTEEELTREMENEPEEWLFSPSKTGGRRPHYRRSQDSLREDHLEEAGMSMDAELEEDEIDGTDEVDDTQEKGENGLGKSPVGDKQSHHDRGESHREMMVPIPFLPRECIQRSPTGSPEKGTAPQEFPIAAPTGPMGPPREKRRDPHRVKRLSTERRKRRASSVKSSSKPSPPSLPSGAKPHRTGATPSSPPDAQRPQIRSSFPDTSGDGTRSSSLSVPRRPVARVSGPPRPKSPLMEELNYSPRMFFPKSEVVLSRGAGKVHEDGMKMKSVAASGGTRETRSSSDAMRKDISFGHPPASSTAPKVKRRKMDAKDSKKKVPYVGSPNAGKWKLMQWRKKNFEDNPQLAPRLLIEQLKKASNTFETPLRKSQYALERHDPSTPRRYGPVDIESIDFEGEILDDDDEEEEEEEEDCDDDDDDDGDRMDDSVTPGGTLDVQAGKIQEETYLKETSAGERLKDGGLLIASSSSLGQGEMDMIVWVLPPLPPAIPNGRYDVEVFSSPMQDQPIFSGVGEVCRVSMSDGGSIITVYATQTAKIFEGQFWINIIDQETRNCVIERCRVDSGHRHVIWTDMQLSSRDFEKAIQRYLTSATSTRSTTPADGHRGEDKERKKENKCCCVM